jgi:hypothetical protein
VLHHTQFLRVNPCLLLNIFAHSPKKTRKKAMEKAQTSTRHLRLRYLLSQRLQIRKRRIRNYDVALFAKQGTDCSHTASPNCHFEIPLPKKPDCHIHILRLLLPQRYILFLHAIATAREIKAGQSDLTREMGELGVTLVPAGRVAVEVEDDVAHVGRRVDGEGKGDVVDCVLVTMLVLATRIEEVGVVGEAGRTN